MKPILFIYIPTPFRQTAKKIAKHLLQKKLIACANIYSGVTSMYRWKGKMIEETECILIVKTKRSLFEKVKKEIERVHPYEIPCIVKIPVTCNEAYVKWIVKTLKQL